MSFTESLDEIVANPASALLGKHPSWERVQLAEVVNVLNGFAFPSTDFSKNEGIPLIGIRDIDGIETETKFKGRGEKGGGERRREASNQAPYQPPYQAKRSESYIEKKPRPVRLIAGQTRSKSHRQPTSKTTPSGNDQTVPPDTTLALPRGATIFALFPLAMHGGPLWRPLCYAQIGGLAVATLITLLLVPVIYSIAVLDLKVIQWRGRIEQLPPEEADESIA